MVSLHIHSLLLKTLSQFSDLQTIEPLGANHPWISAQVELVKV